MYRAAKEWNDVWFGPIGSDVPQTVVYEKLNEIPRAQNPLEYDGDRFYWDLESIERSRHPEWFRPPE